MNNYIKRTQKVNKALQKKYPSKSNYTDNSILPFTNENTGTLSIINIL